MPSFERRSLPHGVPLLVASRAQSDWGLVCLVLERGGREVDPHLRLLNGWMLHTLATTQGIEGLEHTEGSDDARVCVRVTAEDFAERAAEVAKLLTKPKLSSSRVEAMWADFQDDLDLGLFHTSSRAGLETELALYGDTLVGFRQGLVKTSPALHHASITQPDEVGFVAVGAVEADALEEALAAALAGWVPPPAQPEPPRRADKPRDVDVHLFIGGWSDTHIYLAIPAPPASHPDEGAFGFIVHTLGRAQLSRLERQLRTEQGATDRVGLRWPASPSAGRLLLRVSVAPERSLQSIETIRTTLSELAADGITDEELLVARRQARSRLRRDLRSTSGLVARLGTLLRRPDDAWLQKDRAWAAVTADDVRRVAAAYLPKHSPFAVCVDEDVAASFNEQSDWSLRRTEFGSPPKGRRPTSR